MRENLLAQLSQVTLLSGECVGWAKASVEGLATMSPDLQERIDAAEVDNDDGFWPDADDWFSAYRPYRVKDGILQIPVKGVLLSDFSIALGGWATGYGYVRRAVLRGLEDGNVRGIALVLNTPGGAVAENFDLVDLIYESRSIKPIRAFASEHAYSAGYSIASAAETISVARTGGVGSIGVVAWHTDISGLLEKQGVKMTPIFAGSHKVDGNPYETLPANVKSRIQSRIDATYDIFVSTIARNRDMDEQAIRDTEALTFGAQEAVANGLADTVASLDDGLAAFANDLFPQPGGNTMSTKDDASTPVAAVDAAELDQVRATAREEGKAEGQRDGAAAERARIVAICGCDEAKSRTGTAFHLATTTDLTVDQAKSLLAGLPEESAASTAVTTTAFERAMESGNPDLGSGVTDDDGEQASDADLILRDYQAATGIAAK